MQPGSLPIGNSFPEPFLQKASSPQSTHKAKGHDHLSLFELLGLCLPFTYRALTSSNGHHIPQLKRSTPNIFTSCHKTLDSRSAFLPNVVWFIYLFSGYNQDSTLLTISRSPQHNLSQGVAGDRRAGATKSSINTWVGLGTLRLTRADAGYQNIVLIFKNISIKVWSDTQ